MWSYQKSYKKKASWIENFKDIYKNNKQQIYEAITIEEIINTFNRTYKLKLLAPPSILYSSTNDKTYSEIILKAWKKIPDSLIEWVSYQQPKTKETKNLKTTTPSHTFPHHIKWLHRFERWE